MSCALRAFQRLDEALPFGNAHFATGKGLWKRRNFGKKSASEAVAKGYVEPLKMLTLRELHVRSFHGAFLC